MSSPLGSILLLHHLVQAEGVCLTGLRGRLCLCGGALCLKVRIVILLCAFIFKPPLHRQAAQHKPLQEQTIPLMTAEADICAIVARCRSLLMLAMRQTTLCRSEQNWLLANSTHLDSEQGLLILFCGV